MGICEHLNISLFHILFSAILEKIVELNANYSNYYLIVACLAGLVTAGDTCHSCICWAIENAITDEDPTLGGKGWHCGFCDCEEFAPTTISAPEGWVVTPENDIAPLDDVVRRLTYPNRYKSGEFCDHLDEIRNKCSNATFLLELEKEQGRYTTPLTPVYTEDHHILDICKNFRQVQSLCRELGR